MDVSNINKNYIDTTLKQVRDTSKDNNFAKHLNDAINKNDTKELKKACHEFEGIFLNIMYKEMKSTVSKSDLIPHDSSEDIFESMMDENLMNVVSKNSNIGLAKLIFTQLSKQMKQKE